MSIARHHAEWLSLVEVSGPFLSMPVLLRVFPQSLDAHDPEVSRSVRRAFAEWQENQQGLRPDPAIHTAWVRFVLHDGLEFPDELVWGSGIGNQGSVGHIAVTIPEHGEVLRPTLVIGRVQSGPIPDPSSPIPDPSSPIPDPSSPIPDPPSPSAHTNRAARPGS